MADQLDRSEQATPKHRGEARRKGQVAKSQEISSEAAIISGLVALAWLGPAMGNQLLDLTTGLFKNLPGHQVDLARIAPQMVGSTFPVIETLGMWMGILTLGALVAGFSQVGFEFADEALNPQWNRLNPISGLKKIFSWQSAIKAFFSLIKLGLIVYACRGTVQTVIQADALNRTTSPMELVNFLMEASLSLGWRVALVLGLIAAADYAYQKWNHERSLKMTKEEVKEEGKQSEQNPQIRGKIRGLMRQRHKERLSQAVKSASVVITNPTHVAIALKYDRSSMEAPRVVAKGLRLMALRIKELAKENGVPMVENKPLARGLYKHCRVGAQIPSNFYQAVAVVLAQVYRLAGKRLEAAERAQ
jgi:flagellar biosynthesis protein FlhB